MDLTPNHKVRLCRERRKVENGVSLNIQFSKAGNEDKNNHY